MRHKLCRCGGVREDRFGSVCLKCGAGRKHKTRNTTQHGYDGEWNRLSLRKRQDQPLCEKCLERGVITPATQVHHIVSIDDAPWLRLEWSNLMSICTACHQFEHSGRNVVHG